MKQNKTNSSQSLYACTNCGNTLFEEDKKFEAGCGFPSSSRHIGEQVTQNPLNTYGRNRIQLLCSNCGLHLGHLFQNNDTPTGVRYCINENAIRLKE